MQHTGEDQNNNTNLKLKILKFVLLEYNFNFWWSFLFCCRQEQLSPQWYPQKINVKQICYGVWIVYGVCVC